MSEALRGVLKHLVGPASPAVVLSARPVDRRDAQVNRSRGAGAACGVRVRLTGCGGGSPGVGAAGPQQGTAGSLERACAYSVPPPL